MASSTEFHRISESISRCIKKKETAFLSLYQVTQDLECSLTPSHKSLTKVEKALRIEHRQFYIAHCCQSAPMLPIGP